MLEISNKTNLLEQKNYRYQLQDVAEPNLYRDIYDYESVPKVAFNHRRVPMNMPEEIWITDTSFRDGQQSVNPYTVDQIVELYKLMSRLGGPFGIIRQTEFFIYSKKDREALAAQKIADLLPKEYSVYYLSCYQEFEDKFTSEAKYADCMDKLQPFLHNALTEGFTWKNANPPTVATLVYKRMSILKDFMPEVYLWVEKSIKHAIQNKWLVDK